MNPFPGPRPYRAEDRCRFHGREDLARKLLRRVLAHPCITLYGPSGAGKSSLMQAAVIPMLVEEQAFRVVSVDTWPPGEGPVPWLVRSLFADLDLGETPGDLGTAAGALAALDQALSLAEQRSERPILVYLDQIEKILLPNRSTEEGRALVAAIDRMAQKPIRGLQVVVSLREDYLGRFRDRARGRRELLDHSFRLGPLRVHEMAKAVCKAAAEAGQAWDEAHLRRLMVDVRTPGQIESDEAEVEAVFGQIVCRALWERYVIKEAETTTADDVEDILRRYLEATLEDLGPLKHAARQLLEEHLVDPEGNRVLLTETEAIRELRPLKREEAENVLTRCEAAAVLRSEAHLGSRYFELGHDWLAKKVFARRKERAQRRAQRRLVGLAGVAVAAVVLLGAFLLGALRLKSEAVAQRIAAHDASAMSGVRELMARRDSRWARMLLLEVDRPAAQRGWSDLAIDFLSKPVLEATLRDHTFGLGSAAFSTDGRRVVTASFDGTARVWDLDGSRAPLLLKGHTAAVWAAAFSPDGTRVVTASSDKTARVWVLDGSGRSFKLEGHTDEVRSAVFSADGKRVLTGSFDGTARVWDLSNSGNLFELKIELKKHAGEVHSAAFSPDGRRVVTASSDRTARVWDLDIPGSFFELKGHAYEVNSAAFSPDGKRVVTASFDNTARVWDLDAPDKPSIVLKGHTYLVNSAMFSPDGKRVVTASSDKTVRVWELDGSRRYTRIKGHDDVVSSAVFSADGKYIVTASYDKEAQVWKLGDRADYTGHPSVVWSAAFSPDGKLFVTASSDKTARVWERDGLSKLLELKGHTDTVQSAAFSPDGERIVTASLDATARVWKLDGSGVCLKLEGHSDIVNTASFSPDGKRVVTASSDTTARVWEIDGSGKFLALRGHKDAVTSAAFSADSSRIATASVDNTARVWEINGSDRFVELRGHRAAVYSAAFSPDGKHLVTASADMTARVWKLDGSGRFVELKGHKGSVYSAAFSPDGKHVVTASFDKTARVWELDGSDRFIEVVGHAGPVYTAAFSADGNHILTASADKTARIWPSSIQAMQEDLRAASRSCLPIEMRQIYLAETAAEARDRHDACQRALPLIPGPPRL